MSRDQAGLQRRYDWKACAFSVIVGLAIAIPAGLLAAFVFKSTLLLTAVVTVVGTGVSRVMYARVARSGSRPIDDETCRL